MSITADQLWSFPHPTGPVVSPEGKWIWLKVCRTAGSSMWREGMVGQTWLNRGSAYQPQEYKAWLEGETDESLAEYFVFTLIRNPYDRFVSACAYLHVDPVQLMADPIRQFGNPLRMHLMPQYHYTRYADYVGRYEDLQASYETICGMIGQEPVQLPVTNGSNREPYQQALADPELRAFVESLYGMDLATLGYEWEDAPCAD